jgi:drug/metabolite transporter (DMT)-like permease
MYRSAMQTESMLPIALGLFSALTLALANTAVKRGGDILGGRVVHSVTAALILLPFAFMVPLPDRATWQALALAVPLHFGYQCCLIRTLHRGDLSLVFPVMRGLAPLVTGAAAWLALGETLSATTIAGLVIATAAVIVFALPAQKTRLAAHPDLAALAWALATAFGVAAYSVADARGVRTAPQAESFIVWLFLLDWIGVFMLALALRGRGLTGLFRARWHHGAVAGAFSVLSFGATLYAFTMMEVARVSALRETAVVFAALLGWLFLKEGFGRRRTLAALALAGGLALMQLDPAGLAGT